jgi:hypothetical protein
MSSAADMRSIEACSIPPASFLHRYTAGGAYADCYATEIARPVSQAQYVEAFYTTGLFKLERQVLRLISRPSTDVDARNLASGQSDRFAAWHVESRSSGELLVAAGRTRSWLMAVPAGAQVTRLCFGSAVVPERDKDGRSSLGAGFHSLLGFHRLYSRALLKAARSRLESHAKPG